MFSLLALMFGCSTVPHERLSEAGTDEALEDTGFDFAESLPLPGEIELGNGDLAGLSIVRTTPVPPQAEPAPGRVIVGFAEDEPMEETIGPNDGFLAGGLTLLQAYPQRNMGLFEVPSDVDVDEIIETLRASGRYRFVERNQFGRAFKTVDDPGRWAQWNLDTIDAERAWDHSTGVDIVVAVIDSGVQDNGDDGIYAIDGGYDFVDGDDEATEDLCGHGTHVAGTIAQRTNNGIGMAGIAHHATIMPYRTLTLYEDAYGNQYCLGSEWDTIQAVDHAVESGAHVINMSFGFDQSSEAFNLVLEEARAAGVVLVAASGNNGNSDLMYPAAYDGVIGVGAVGFDDELAYYSSYGAHQDLVAPGGEMYADTDGDGYLDSYLDANEDGYADGIVQENYDYATGLWGYDFLQGTSMAAPHVAASAALLMSVCATSAEVEDFLLDTALDLGEDGDDLVYGAGLLQTGTAVETFLDYTDLDGDGYADPMSSEDVGVFCNRPPSPACVADFNGDGVVDSADYTIWSDNAGCTDCEQSQGDASGDGNVDSEDYDLWSSFFNQACYG